MQTAILCGGRGRRLGDNEIPKALFPIGGKPILWHIMNIYAHQGFNNFLLCLGYKANKIKENFLNLRNWRIIFCDTGLDTNTGGRIKKIEHFIKDDLFFATYGDGLADIRLDRLLEFHKSHHKIATITVVRPHSPFGIVGIDKHTQVVTHFAEKPLLDCWINGGFFVFNKEIFRYLKDDDVLEKDSFRRLLKDRQIVAYKHPGFWRCMDTYKDNLELNVLWKENRAAWKTW